MSRNANQREPKSVLIFLGTCLGFAEAAISVIAGTSDASGTALLIGALAALITVVAALITMYWINPAFIIAQQAHLLPLTMLQALAAQKDSELFKAIVLEMDWTDLLRGMVQPVKGADVESREDSDEKEELDSAWAELENIRQKRSQP